MSSTAVLIDALLVVYHAQYGANKYMRVRNTATDFIIDFSTDDATWGNARTFSHATYTNLGLLAAAITDEYAKAECIWKDNYSMVRDIDFSAIPISYLPTFIETSHQVGSKLSVAIKFNVPDAADTKEGVKTGFGDGSAGSMPQYLIQGVQMLGQYVAGEDVSP